MRLLTVFIILIPLTFLNGDPPRNFSEAVEEAPMEPLRVDQPEPVRPLPDVPELPQPEPHPSTVSYEEWLRSRQLPERVQWVQRNFSKLAQGPLLDPNSEVRNYQFLGYSLIRHFFDHPANGDIEGLKAEAKTGDGYAQFNYGLICLEGYGQLKDSIEGIRWMEEAHESGIIEASYNLAVIFSEDKIAKPDYNRAMRLFQKAADGGINMAYRKLSGMESDIVKAYAYMSIARHLEVEMAGRFLLWMESTMTREQRLEGEALASRMFAEIMEKEKAD